MKVLKANNITKIFPGVVALDAVNIEFELGEIHCVIGENGAGKSTLIKCLTGVYQPEKGSIHIHGSDVENDRSLFDKIAYVPQEIDLFWHMTVAENLFLPFEKSGFRGLVKAEDLEERAISILKRFNINVSPDTSVKDISVSEQQLLQIARATVHEDFDVLMLDEPTTSLTTEDTQRLFEIIMQIKNDNKSVIFISHKLEEIFSIGDVITVFRNGEKVAYSDLKEVDIPWVISQMTGRKVDHDQDFYSTNVSDEVVMKVEHLTGEKFTDVSFDLKKGEILGFAGLVGAGRSELMQAIFGCLPIYKGSVEVNDENWKLGDTNASVNKGLIYLPEERKTQGILPVLSIRENVTVSVLDKVKANVGISKKKEFELVSDIIDKYDVKTPDMEKEIKFLSGGNQQKVIIGRAMCTEPKIIVFDEPTKGIDVGTKVEIYKMMKQLAEENGLSIILISSEMEEVMKCSNRIIALYHGEKVDEFEAGTNKEDILSAIIGVKSNEKEKAV